MLRRVLPQLQRTRTIFFRQHRLPIAGLSIEANTKDINNKLRIAIEKADSADLVKRLLELNSDPNAIEIYAKHDENVKYKVPPVFYVLAQYRWHAYDVKSKIIPKTIGLHLIAKADLTHINFQHPISGFSALHHAAVHTALYDDLDFLKKLLECNANPHLETSSLKNTALQLLNRSHPEKTRTIEVANQLLIDAMINHPLTTDTSDSTIRPPVFRGYSLDDFR